ncbi:unnamed protein product, partial [Linum tenue]
KITKPGPAGKERIEKERTGIPLVSSSSRLPRLQIPSGGGGVAVPASLSPPSTKGRDKDFLPRVLVPPADARRRWGQPCQRDHHRLKVVLLESSNNRNGFIGDMGDLWARGVSSIQVSFVHYLPGIFASIAALMFNCVRKEDIDYSPYDEGEWRLKLWLFFAYVVSFVSLAASVGLLIQDSIVKDGPSVWTGVAEISKFSLLIGQCLFSSSLVRSQVCTDFGHPSLRSLFDYQTTK